VNLFFSAGEASGDAYIAELVGRLPEGFQLFAIGSKRASAAGCKLVADSSHWGALSIVEALRVVPRALAGNRAAKRFLTQSKPGIFIPIDFGYLNVKLAKLAKSKGWKVLYFIPPGSWRKDKQGGDLPAVCDVIVTPFPWSAEILRGMGGNAHFFGHPILEMVGPPIDGEREVKIALMPGSRRHEIENNAGVMAEVSKRFPSHMFEIALATNASESELRERWVRAGANLEQLRFSTDRYTTLKTAQAAILCSGTATLEAAIADCPMVVMYRGSKWMEFEYRIRKPKFDFIALPNIFAGKSVVPEFIQWDANPENVGNALQHILGDGAQMQHESFAEIREMLQPAKCFQKTIEQILILSQSNK
jgi:lipid-A-disaccharide synthase